MRLLNSDFYVMLFKNALGSYSASAFKREELNIEDDDVIFDTDERRITDAPTPSKALQALSEKVLKTK